MFRWAPTLEVLGVRYRNTLPLIMFAPLDSYPCTRIWIESLPTTLIGDVYRRRNTGSMEWATVQHLDLRHVGRGQKLLQPHAAAFHPTQALVAAAIGNYIIGVTYFLSWRSHIHNISSPRDLLSLMFDYWIICLFYSYLFKPIPKFSWLMAILFYMRFTLLLSLSFLKFSVIKSLLLFGSTRVKVCCYGSNKHWAFPKLHVCFLCSHSD